MSELRALVGARVSVYRGDSKISNVTQVKTAMDWAEKNGQVVVGTFEDLDVSADKFSPFKRPDLGQWLTEERAHEWDSLVFAKTDRVFRKAADCAELTAWLEAHRKILVLVDDNMVLNFRDDSSPFDRTMARFFLTIAAFFAEMELERVRARIKDTHRDLRQTQRWMNGTPSMGFTTAPALDGRGRVLVHDPDGQETLHEVARRLFAGHSWNKISQDLNEAPCIHALCDQECPEECAGVGVLTNLGRSRLKSGKPITPNAWAPTTLIDIMTSPVTQGIKVDKHKNPILGAEGNEIIMCDPSFSANDWDRIQLEVAKRKNSGKQRVHSANPVLGYGYCGRCGASLSRKVSQNRKDGPEYRYFRCGNAKKRCAGVNIREDVLLSVLENTFLSNYGTKQVTRRILIPGSDNRQDLARIESSIKRLKAESDADLLDISDDEYVKRLGQLTKRKRELEVEPVTPSRWVDQTTDQTYAEAWTSKTTEERREMLRDSGFRVLVRSKTDVEIQDLATDGKSTPLRALFQAMNDSDIQGMTVTPDGVTVTSRGGQQLEDPR
ncbi:recombinase family protein [Nocardia lijiangensis]|uniref:recombinase family protein n=1 Tax=Nocardia lijiangensis TaxID=299618 RepID=UPI00082AAA54|nr:recombinase family protein [Nocardia lijiangensis]